MWREFIAEISALGWLAFVKGPEIHLALPILYFALALSFLLWRRK